MLNNFCRQQPLTIYIIIMNTRAFNLAWLSLRERAKVYNSRASFRKRCQEGGGGQKYG